MSIEKTTVIGEILQRLKLAKKFRTDKAIAEYLGVSGQAVSLWIKRNSQTPIDKILNRSKGDVCAHYLLTGEGPMLEPGAMSGSAHIKVSATGTLTGIGEMTTKTEPSNVSKHYEHAPSVRIPLISWVQAGEWQFAADHLPPGVADEWLETSATNSKHAYALTIHGDSMEPEFREGDIVTVDPERQAENGSFVIIKNGVEATFKQLVLDGPSVYLKPLNDRYPIKDMTGIEFRIVGVVVEKRKRY